MKYLFAVLLTMVSVPAFAVGHHYHHHYAYHGSHHGSGYVHEKAHGDHGSDVHSLGHGHK
ncbi:hypothetical protein [Aquirhabdus sp.]|uniref:hypothetical protein n=1 Tax=Aquirhabdus sp. TaxID=2824160 RepID=UPI00396CF6CE